MQTHGKDKNALRDRNVTGPFEKQAPDKRSKNTKNNLFFLNSFSRNEKSVDNNLN